MRPFFSQAIATGQGHSYFRAPLVSARQGAGSGASLPTPSPAIMSSIISVANLSKTYASGFQALKNVDLEIRRGEIFALLGPNGAGKTTLISIICGIVNPSEGTVLVDGHDIVARLPRGALDDRPRAAGAARPTRSRRVWATVSFSRGLFGKPPNPAHIEKVLRDLSLWDKKDSKIMTLSGGMKRRVMIAKALSHEPQILFLDEPTAGVDVELRRDMWELVRALRESGVTIILTTHYIEEAEEMADRIGVINKGEIILVEDKATLMRKLGKKQLTLQLQAAARRAAGGARRLRSSSSRDDGSELDLHLRRRSGERTGIAGAAAATSASRASASRICTPAQSSLEDIFVEPRREAQRVMNLPRHPRDLPASRWRAPGARCCRASSRR